jgi:hypothetical protein
MYLEKDVILGLHRISFHLLQQATAALSTEAGTANNDHLRLKLMQRLDDFKHQLSEVEARTYLS